MDTVSHVPATNRMMVYGVLAVSVVVALSTGVYLFAVLKVPLPGPFGEMSAARNLPAELSQVHLITDTLTESTLIRKEDGAFTRLPLRAHLISGTVDQQGYAQIRKTEAGAFQVVVNDQVIIEDTEPHMGISRAPGGAHIAFAVTTEPDRFLSSVDGPGLTWDRQSWKVVVYRLSDGLRIDLGRGASPSFIDDTHLAWFSPAGLMISNIETNTTHLAVPDVGGRLPVAQLVSPDRSVIGWYEEKTRNLLLYKVTATGATKLAVIVPPTPIRYLTLSNDTLYALRTDAFSSQVLAQPFTSTQVVSVYRVPNAMRVHRMLLGSL